MYIDTQYIQKQLLLYLNARWTVVMNARWYPIVYSYDKHLKTYHESQTIPRLIQMSTKSENHDKSHGQKQFKNTEHRKI